MPSEAKPRSGRIIDIGLVAMQLVGLLIFGRWFVGTIGGEFDPAQLVLALGLIVVGTAIRMIR